MGAEIDYLVQVERSLFTEEEAEVTKAGKGGAVHSLDLCLLRRGFVWLLGDPDWHRDHRERRFSYGVDVCQ